MGWSSRNTSSHKRKSNGQLGQVPRNGIIGMWPNVRQVHFQVPEMFPCVNHGTALHPQPCDGIEPPLSYSRSALFLAGSRLQSRIIAHAIRGLDAETTPFCFRHLSPSDLAEDSCDGNFNAGKVTRPMNSHLISPCWADPYSLGYLGN
jgi:hypothetical protein